MNTEQIRWENLSVERALVLHIRSEHCNNTLTYASLLVAKEVDWNIEKVSMGGSEPAYDPHVCMTSWKNS